MKTDTQIRTTDARVDQAPMPGSTPTRRRARRPLWLVAVVVAAVFAVVVSTGRGPGGEPAATDQLDSYHEAYRSTLGDGAHEAIAQRMERLIADDAAAQAELGQTQQLDDHRTRYRIVLRDGATTRR